MFEVPLGENLVRRLPVIFSDQFVHLHVAQTVLKMPEMKHAKAVSAGMIDHFWCTFGGSQSMNLGSRPGDGHLISMPQMYLTGNPTEPEPYKVPYKLKSGEPSLYFSGEPEQPKPKSGDWGTTKPEI
jgi:hypothetical protein